MHGSIGCHSDIWETTESWAELFTINKVTICKLSRPLVPLQFVKNSEVLLGYGSWYHFSFRRMIKFYLYGTDVYYHLDLCDFKLGTSINLKFIVYAESLAMLNSGNYVALPEIEDSKASARTVDLENFNSGAHVGGVQMAFVDDDDSEDEDIAKGLPVSPKSVTELRKQVLKRVVKLGWI